jgi:hypothetical protein
MTKTELIKLLEPLLDDAPILLWSNETGQATKLEPMLMRNQYALYLYDSTKDPDKMTAYDS